ncbi:uncharacterized protein C17orf50 homolog [Xenopus tropicalis]|uniref:Uncharacterized protein C17orf50 homolog n=1 Tax=Xenopus tropicalis TaxID=8364 RepID=A0A8J1J5Z4_XENTR|nr:uncharacterized protein C17orf50 homolog [Xenopus tropicalis]
MAAGGEEDTNCCTRCWTFCFPPRIFQNPKPEQNLKWRPSLPIGRMEDLRKPQAGGAEPRLCVLDQPRPLGPCYRCAVLLCPACDTLHCDPQYISHCILGHPDPPAAPHSQSQDPLWLRPPTYTSSISLM